MKAQLAATQGDLLRTKAGLSDLRTRLPALEEEAQQEREAQIMTEVVPRRIEDALAQFKTGPMQEELRLAWDSALEEFKSVNLPGLL